MRALPKRLARDSGETRVERFAEAPCFGQSFAQHLQRMKTELSEALTLEQHPVVVPVRQQIGAEQRSAESRLTAAEHAANAGLDVANVHRCVGIDSQLLVARVDERTPEPPEAPKRGAQIGMRTCLRAVEPQRTGDVRPLQWMVVQRDERDHPLSAHRDRHRLALVRELEPPEQSQLRRCPSRHHLRSRRRVRGDGLHRHCSSACGRRWLRSVSGACCLRC